MMQVWEFMSEPVTSIRKDQELKVVEEIMRQARIRHLPIVDDAEQVVGIISQRDLFRAALQRVTEADTSVREAWTVRVEEVMQREVMTVEVDEDMQRAARTMVQCKIGCLPVVKEGRLRGIITEHDLLRILADVEVRVIEEAGPTAGQPS